MEDKKINEQESLNLISNMIKQTNNHMALGAGNIQIAWGCVLALVSIFANVAMYITGNGNWIWSYFAIFAIGIPIEMWLSRKAKQKSEGLVKTYLEDSLNKVWQSTTKLLWIFPLVLLLMCNTFSSHAWIVMFFLGMFLPAINSYITGVFLKHKGIIFCSGFACAMSLIFLAMAIDPNFRFTLPHTFHFPLCAIFSMVIPGIMINQKAAEENK